MTWHWQPPTVSKAIRKTVLVVQPKRPVSRRRANPQTAKPRPDFPLTLHSTGQWCKTIRGKRHYFGRDADQALQRYLGECDELHAGKTPNRKRTDPTIQDACNLFLDDRHLKLESGELTKRSFHDYHVSCQLLIEYIDKTRFVAELSAPDFAGIRAELAQRFGPVTLGNHIGRIRAVFNFLFDNGAIDVPVRWGKSFQKPSKKTMRLHRNAQPKKFYRSAELHDIIKYSSDQLTAMILLGINCGLGNKECAELELSHIQDGWLIYPRNKTGIERTCPLWAETREAIETIIDNRKQPSIEQDENKVFLTKYGNSWLGKGTACPVSAAFKKATVSAGVAVNGNSFYALRHTFETVAGGSKDQVAVNHIMGHVDDSMADRYREGIDRERLEAVIAHVHAWLFGGTSR